MFRHKDPIRDALRYQEQYAEQRLLRTLQETPRKATGIVDGKSVEVTMNYVSSDFSTFGTFFSISLIADEKRTTLKYPRSYGQAVAYFERLKVQYGLEEQ